jgi:hypothetical protein
MKSFTQLGAFVCTLSFIVAGVAFANANSTTVLCNFAPNNDLKIPVAKDRAHATGLDEATYDAVITRVESYYKPLAAAKGGVLTINRMWTDATVNSDARRTGKNWYIDAFGGLARYNGMTADSEMAVLCHEMGHQLGGFPRFSSIFGSNWAAVEGQADYFATSKCFRRLAATDNNVELMASHSIPSEVVTGCEKTFKSAAEIALCEREALAGNLLAQILYELGTSPSSHVIDARTHEKTPKSPKKPADGEPATPPSFATPSTAVVAKTYQQHPLAQCRLDTYFNGAICGADPTEDFSETEGVTGACAQEAGATYGYRPNCWYKPAKN